MIDLGTMAEASSGLLKNGMKIAGWKLQGFLGSGGQAEVWSANYTKGRRPGACAIKVALVRNEKQRQRMLSEVRLLAAFDHAHLMPVIDSGTIDVSIDGEPVSCPFYVMPRAVGPIDDARHICRGLLQNLDWFRQVLLGVAVLHGRQVLHRDLKPSNILIEEFGSELRARVSDFGLAKSQTLSTDLTATRELVGTAPYMAPEVLQGHEHSVRSDIYALGKILEFVVTQSVPDQLTPRPISESEPVSDRARRQLHAVIERATTWSPGDRFETVAELQLALPTLVIDVADDAPVEHAAEAQLIPFCPVGPRERIGHWTVGRSGKTREVFWSGGSHAYVGVAPTRDLGARWTPFDLEKIERGNGRKLPRLDRLDQHSWSRNEHGLVVFPLPTPTDQPSDWTDSFSMVTKWGHVWALSSTLCSRTADEGTESIKYLPTVLLENQLSAVLAHAVAYLEADLDVPGPYLWRAGLRWVSGFRLALSRDSSREFSELNYDDEISWAGTIASGDDAEQTLLPFFTKLWNSFGMDKPTRRG